jgi:hypothetical protein
MWAEIQLKNIFLKCSKPTGSDYHCMCLRNNGQLRKRLNIFSNMQGKNQFPVVFIAFDHKLHIKFNGTTSPDLAIIVGCFQ